MRVLNTNIDPIKQFKRFTFPGFRSGSVIKGIIASVYYFFVLVFMCSITITYLSGKFSGAKDVLVFIAVELSLLAMFLSPVIAIGYSRHFGWNGIRLFLIIMVPICVFSTLGNYLSTLFSTQYIESVNPSEKQIEEFVDSAASSDADDILMQRDANK